MNFLAHAYLSFNSKEILVGNMISDFVKGSSQYQYTEGIQKGIRLHRKIDEFTDVHEATIKAKTIFRKDYRLFSGAIVDVVFDHFLANHPPAFAELNLADFIQTVYRTLEEYSTHLPANFLQAFTYMQAENWLLNYQYKEGVEKSIRGMVRRSSFFTDSKTAVQLFIDHYVFLQQCFGSFFVDVKDFSKKEFDLLIAA